MSGPHPIDDRGGGCVHGIFCAGMNAEEAEKSMRTERVNRASAIALVVLSLTALATVIIGLALPAMMSTHRPSVQADEGTGAHIFQLSILALVPVGLVFLATADWTQPLRSLRRLALPAAAVVLAFGVLYFFERLR